MTKGMKKAFVRMLVYGAITVISFAIGASRASAGLMMIIPTVCVYLYTLNWDSLEKLNQAHEEKKSKYCPIKEIR